MIAVTLFLCVLAAAAVAEEPRPRPANPKVTPEARQLLDFLQQIHNSLFLFRSHGVDAGSMPLIAVQGAV